jgi:hypothetical protein
MNARSISLGKLHVKYNSFKMPACSVETAHCLPWFAMEAGRACFECGSEAAAFAVSTFPIKFAAAQSLLNVLISYSLCPHRAKYPVFALTLAPATFVRITIFRKLSSFALFVG